MTTTRILPRFAQTSAQTNETKSSSSTTLNPQNLTSQNPSQRNDSFAYSRPGTTEKYIPSSLIARETETKKSFFGKLFKSA